MSAKVRALCEKLARQPMIDVLAELLRFDQTISTYSGGGDETENHACCEGIGEHSRGCTLDRLLTEIGLPTAESRNTIREATR